MLRKILYLCLLLLLLTGCGSKKNTGNSTDLNIPKQDKTGENNSFDITSNDNFDKNIKFIVEKFNSAQGKLKNKKISVPQYKISPAYQKVPLEFNELNIQQWNEIKIGVIGTSGVKMYTDIKATKEICEIPKGAIIDLKKLYNNPKTAKSDQENNFDSEGDFYEFNNELNYWYEAEYQGKKGFVFGSYIVRDQYEPMDIAFGNTNRTNSAPNWEKIVRLAYYYTKNTKSDQFYNFNGIATIPDNIQTQLIKDKFALQKISRKEYGLYILEPDDMISLYKKLHGDRMADTFITIDFLTHNLHLIFDRMLESTESKYLFPIAKMLTDRYFNKIVDYEGKIASDETVLKESVTLLKNYFLVAKIILNYNSLEDMPADIPDEVKKEIDYIEKAEGFVEKTPLFQYKEDYSQFKPRGHYTKSQALQKYFKAMIWYGRLHFYCVENFSPAEDKAALRLTPVALLLTMIAKEDKELYNLWKALSGPITYVIGNADDYNLDQYLTVANNVDFDHFGRWLENPSNIIGFIKKANKEIASPRISGNTLLQNGELYAEEDAKTPAGFRFLGQRFTFDSFIHNRLSSPRVGTNDAPRNMVKGVDVMGVMGSQFADNQLAFEKKEIPRFEKNYNALIKEFKKFDQEDWRSTFYNSYLKIIKESACFENTLPFYFTQSENWNKRSLLTAFGAWAELRHDTILYVKQSYGEMAGKGPEPTWVIDPVERPIGYVEPNLGALYWLQSVLEDSINILGDNGFMTSAYLYKFNDYLQIINKLTLIAEKEAADEPITNDMNEYIYSVPYKLAKIILPESGSEVMEEKDFQMALVADVHTDGIAQEVLEAATGIPYRIYVALNDAQGGTRIAEGYTYSYYEFRQPINNRLNDDQWKAQVYGADTKIVDEKRPEWITGIVLP